MDLFCGTGSVAVAAAKRGWDVHLNDTLTSAVVVAAARLLSPDAVRFAALGGYEGAIARLNRVASKEGFIFREYSPASLSTAGIERRYFTKVNAGAIDGIRHQIDIWYSQNIISENEKTLLIADLLSAANRVANIAGTYGCFLSKWQKQASDMISLRARELNNRLINVTTSAVDAFDVRVRSGDTVYLDPPYTKRQYAAYYHILETIAVGDEPTVEGVAGLRPWRSKASAFCYKTRALDALSNLVSGLSSERIFLSYSDNAHISIDALTSQLHAHGFVGSERLKEISRYRPNRAATKGRSTVSEYLITVSTEAVELAA